MFKTIRAQLLVILLLFITVTLIASITLFNYFENSKDAISGITKKTEKIHLLLLQDMILSHDFIENETINPQFFSSQKSKLYRLHDSTWKKIDEELEPLFITQSKYNFDLGTSLARIKSKLSTYKFFTNEIFKKVLVRGFKDYGVEGKMRVYAHELEKYQQELGLINILQLRRHEKDFIIRQEDPYIFKHQELIRLATEKLNTNTKLQGDKRYRIEQALNHYANEFNNLVVYEKMLGLKSNKGLKTQIDEVSKDIMLSLESLVRYSVEKETGAIANIRMVYLVTGLIFILIAVISAIIISRYTSRSIRDLQKDIHEFVRGDFSRTKTLSTKKTNSEIATLRNNFSIMEQHIAKQVSQLKKNNRDLETLFYVASHDLRPPLLKTKQLTGESLKNSSEQTTIENLKQIDIACEQAIAIVDELDLITNLKHSDILVEEINLHELIRSVYSEFKGAEGTDDLLFLTDINTSREIVSSKGLIKSIFRNIIDNGIKYATKRKSASFIKIQVNDQNDEMLRIDISDNGVGIKKEIQEQIFTMFFRGTDQVKGAGMGLYVAQCAVEKLDGAIGVESDGKSGCSFTILLPTHYKIKNNRSVQDIQQSAFRLN